MPAGLDRRRLLKLSVLGAGSALLSGGASRAAAQILQDKPAGRAIRVAHLTDTHVQPERGGDEGMRACLRHVQEHSKPDLILFGGDNIFDAFGQTRERAGMLFDLWNKVIADECRTPVLYTLGNHDIWGWNKTKSKTSGSEDGWGKDWAVKNYAMPGRYYSADQGGWHFVILDSVQPEGDGYIAMIDDEQFAWLEADLAKTDPSTPVLICSHIPIVSMTPLMSEKIDEDPTREDAVTQWKFGRGAIHIDARRLKELFKKHPNVKLAISGHIHMVDRIDYLGVSYLCNTAVSGSWWKGPHHEFDAGYTVLDLNPDGGFSSERVSYGWKARA